MPYKKTTVKKKKGPTIKVTKIKPKTKKPITLKAAVMKRRWSYARVNVRIKHGKECKLYKKTNSVNLCDNRW